MLIEELKLDILYIYRRCSLAENGFLKINHFVLLVIVRKLVEDFLACFRLEVTMIVEALSTNASGKIEVFLHHCNAGSMNSTEVSIFEETCQIALSSLL